MTRMLVTGAGGLLGSEVVRGARGRGYEVEGPGRAALDVTDRAAVRAAVVGATQHAEGGFTDVIHCAAYTAVDRAEEEPERAMRVNRDGTRHVAEAAAEAGARFVYVSTDYVFDGEARAPYLPSARTGPLGVYGASKLEGEHMALGSQKSALVVRTSWLYGSAGRNFVTTMLDLGRRRTAGVCDRRQADATEPLRIVADQTGRPSWARHVAADILDLLERRVRGVWHAADGGEATWLDVARETFRLAGLAVPVEGVTTEARGAPAPRPRYSVLDLAGTEVLLGRSAVDWREALRAFLTETGDIDAG